MIRWTELDTAILPGGGCMRLMRRGSEFSITLDGAELMNSRRGGSEAVLAIEACRRLRGGSAVQILIGGLGLGFTLRAALAELEPSATVAVVELVPQVIGWAHETLAPVFEGCLADPRLRLLQGDVADHIAACRAAYDAIILDVDNGPDGLVLPANDRLYAGPGLRAMRSALRPGGVLAVWSASPDPAFMRRLRSARFDVDEATARSAGRKGARHVVYLATPTPAARPPANTPCEAR